MPYPKIDEDILNLNKTKLREKYQSTYASWKNMKSRRHNGYTVHPDFENFTDFLSIMGPRPGKDFTLDRLDPNDPEYAPEKVKWSDKTEQSSNQSRTIKLEYKGQTKPLTQWCREYNLKADTVRRRYHKGGSVEDILFGKDGTPKFRNVARAYHTTEQKWPWLSSRRAVEWEQHFKEGHRHLESRYEFFLEEAEKALEDSKTALQTLHPIAEACIKGHQKRPEIRDVLININMSCKEVIEECGLTLQKWRDFLLVLEPTGGIHGYKRAQKI